MSAVDLAALRALADSWANRPGNDALPSGPRYGPLAEQEDLANGVLALVEAVEAAQTLTEGHPEFYLGIETKYAPLLRALAPFRQEQP